MTCVPKVIICDLSTENDGDFATDDPRILRMFARHRQTSQGSKGADILLTKDHIKERNALFAAEENEVATRLPTNVARIAQRRTKPDGTWEYCVEFDDGHQAVYVDGEFWMKDDTTMGLKMQFDDNVAQEQELSKKEAPAVYKQFLNKNHVYVEGLSASTLTCRLHDFGIDDTTIERMILIMDTNHNGALKSQA